MKVITVITPNDEERGHISVPIGRYGSEPRRSALRVPHQFPAKMMKAIFQLLVALSATCSAFSQADTSPLEAAKAAEQAIRLSRGTNGRAYYQAGVAMDYIGSPIKEHYYMQQALRLGPLSAAEREVAQRIAKDLTPLKSVLWNDLDAGEARRGGLARGGVYFYYPVPPSWFFNQTAAYTVTGALKWEKIESNGDTFLKIWPGETGTIRVTVVVLRYPAYRKLIVEDHSIPLPPYVSAFTNSTRFIDARSPEIAAVAKMLRKTNWVETAKAIGKYVEKGWNNVATGVSTQSSSSALRTRTGMCMDKANLCVALARANGIPARMVHGSEPLDKEGKFARTTIGHFWAEIYVPGTGWCEFVADSEGFGGMPWFCTRWYWQDTATLWERKWDRNATQTLDLAIAPPLIDPDMERPKYILWFGMTDQSISQIGTCWHMEKSWRNPGEN